MLTSVYHCIHLPLIYIAIKLCTNSLYEDTYIISFLFSLNSDKKTTQMMSEHHTGMSE